MSICIYVYSHTQVEGENSGRGLLRGLKNYKCINERMNMYAYIYIHICIYTYSYVSLSLSLSLSLCLSLFLSLSLSFSPFLSTWVYIHPCIYVYSHTQVEGEKSGRGLLTGLQNMFRVLFDPVFEPVGLWHQVCRVSACVYAVQW